MNSPEDTNGPVIRDLRRIDPVTGQVRDPGQQGRQAPGKPRQPGRHAASKPGGTGARPSQPGGGGPASPGSTPGGPGMPGGPGAPGAPGPGTDAAAAGNAGGQAAGGPGGTSPAGPPGGPGAQPGRPDGADPALAAQLAERTADLQRIQAEYANYRKRVERDRMAVREQALANVLSSLLPVLDDIGRAREHGELTGGFKSVGESLETTAAKLGLESFGDAGEPFDPRIHEALTHTYSPDVTEPTAVQILQPGYRVGDRIVRPARVAVAEPSDGPTQGSPDEPRGTPAGNN